MQLRDALNDYKSHRNSRTAFPGERRTTAGRFSGFDNRLVHIDESGSLRDFSYPLSGLNGIARSRFGVQKTSDQDADPNWFDAESSVQHYDNDTGLVVTKHEIGSGTVQQYDLTLGNSHITHFDLGDVEKSLNIVIALGFAPDNRDTGIAQIHHDGAVEVYHAQETNYLASATGFGTVAGVVPEGLSDLLSESPTDYPPGRSPSTTEENLLSGDVFCTLPIENESATLTTLLTTRDEMSREPALDMVRTMAEYQNPERLAESADEQAPVSLGSNLPYKDAVAADLRVLSLLTGRSGLRIAGPDFDPYFTHSGGYGYSWFRDDAEISRYLYEVDQGTDLELGNWHRRSAESYSETQHDDGTWPHRVWPFDMTLAPGWANGRLGTDEREYQADQTASVVTFLATYGAENRHQDAIERALDGLDASLKDDARPATCQNAWEDMTGRFTHTAATFLEAYSTVATLQGDVADRAATRATDLYDALDDLWIEERGIYSLREYGPDHDDHGTLDERCDAATLALVSAHRAYARIETIDEKRLDRLVSHVETVIETLQRDPPSGAVAGLIRYEGDNWRRREQDDEKIWTVSTAWGAHAAGTLAVMLADRRDARADDAASTARRLLALLLPDGPLCLDSSYLPEQVFDDGTADSATPLGWPHAIRLATIALLHEHDLLDKQPAAADD